jgi:sialic acid synthase SpsE
MSKPFIIAELGSNWKSLDDCKTSTVAAKRAGADAIKFQLFDHKALYGYEGKDPVGTMPREWIPLLHAHAKKYEIEFMCTAFDQSGYDFVNEYVDTHKVASSNIGNIPLLKHVGGYGKKVILSTGASCLSEIGRAVDCLGGCEVVLLYCVASYPAKLIEIEKIQKLKQYFGGKHKVGYSDHSIDVLVIPKAAKDAGAEVIEKHYNPLRYTDTPDAPHSLDTYEFGMMSMTIRYGDAFGSNYNYTHEEVDMIHKHKNRCMAIKDIKKGDVFKLGDNFGVYRSKAWDDKALSGQWAEKLDGNMAVSDVRQGEGIGPL